MNTSQKLILGAVALVALMSAVNSADAPTYKAQVKKDNQTVTCLMMQGFISVDVDYMEVSTNKTKHLNFTISDNATTVGTCGNMTDSLGLLYVDGEDDLTLTFFFNKTSDTYKLGNVSLTGNAGKNDSHINYGGKFVNFTTEVGSSYNCSKATKLTMDHVTISLSKLRIEAFKDDKAKNPSFSTTVNDCDPVYKPTDAIVPIAVGAALAGMVIIVLVGYCIGRRKTRAGYQNMNA